MLTCIILRRYFSGHKLGSFMSKFLLKMVIFSHFLVYLSLPVHAMKRNAEISEDEFSSKRQKIEQTHQQLPERQKLLLDAELIETLNGEAFYVENLMYEFFKKLHRLAWEKNIKSPEKRLAWLQTMYAILYKTYNTAWKVGSDASFVRLESKPWKKALSETRKEVTSSALCLTVQALGNLAREIDETKAFMAENDVADVHNVKLWSDIKNTVQDIVDSKIKENDNLSAFRIAVDETFRLLLENFENKFNRTYQFYSQTSRIPTELETERSLIKLLNNHISEMDLAQICFLTPWLVHVMPFNALSASQRPFCELLWGDTYAYPLLYPLVRSLFLLRAQWEFNLDLINRITNFIMHKLITEELYDKCDNFNP